METILNNNITDLRFFSGNGCLYSLKNLTSYLVYKAKCVKRVYGYKLNVKHKESLNLPLKHPKRSQFLN